jgi:hypothetical protein
MDTSSAISFPYAVMNFSEIYAFLVLVLRSSFTGSIAILAHMPKPHYPNLTLEY